MIKYCAKILIVILAIAFLIPFIVSANNGGSAQGGTTGDIGNACPSCTWRHWRQAMRFTLYRYDGTNLSYYKSVDYCINAADCDDFNAYHNGYGVGKSAYQQLNSYSAATNWRMGRLSSIRYDASFSGEIFNGYEDSGLSSDVESFFKLNDTDVNILNTINSVFSQSLTISELGQAYITVEPALIIKNETSNNYYYGTAHELNSYFMGGDLGGNYGINAQVYYDLGNVFRASSIYGNYDEYNFIGNIVNLVSTSNLSSRDSTWGNSASRQNNATKITSKDGYGIVVYWMGNYADAVSCSITESADQRMYTLSVQNTGADEIYYDINSNANLMRHNVRNQTYNATYSDQTIIGEVYDSDGTTVATCSKTRSIPTCNQTCAGKTGDELLGCAEDYCQYMSNDDDSKRNCIVTCGYSDPGFSTCSSSASNNGTNTVCDNDTSANKEVCTRANSNNYFKTTCNDSSTIKYGNSLPVTINPGSGFSYTPIVMGAKTCEMTFEAEKWKFDYAASYTNEKRNSLIAILSQFNNVGSTSIWVQDINDNYKYKSNDADIEIEVTNNNEVGAANRTTIKQLFPDDTINLLSNEIVVSVAGSINIPLFSSGARTTRTVYGMVKTNSSNKTSYKLPGTCMVAGDGTLYDLGPNGNCDSSNDGPYYEYFTDLKIGTGTYDTKTLVVKSSSSLNVNNTCDYNINSPVSCSIKVVDCTSGQPEKAELRIENKNNLSISYGLSHREYILNSTKTYNLNASMTKLYGAVGVDGKIVATCSLDLNSVTCDGPPEDGEPLNCVAKFKPAEYSSIKDYCSSHWLEDINGYASEKDCVSSCSVGANTCKNNSEVDTNNVESVKAFCSIKKNRDDNGYNKAGYSDPLKNELHNIAMCINDCMDFPLPPPTLGQASYLYRPISLIDPFPNNRDAGHNWYGKEVYITDDLLNPVLNSGADAEYIIELNPDRIDAINKDTDEYNKGRNKNAYLDYVYFDEDSQDGKYVSKFIHSNDENSGGFGLYFTKLKD